MTEQEAKTKWCPFARVTWQTDATSWNRVQDGAGNVDEGTGNACKCLGSDCMAWRATKGDEEPLIEAVRRYRNENGASLKDAKEYVETHPEYRRGTPDGGFCGLAGKP